MGIKISTKDSGGISLTIREWIELVNTARAFDWKAKPQYVDVVGKDGGIYTCENLKTKKFVVRSRLACDDLLEGTFFEIRGKNRIELKKALKEALIAYEKVWSEDVDWYLKVKAIVRLLGKGAILVV